MVRKLIIALFILNLVFYSISAFGGFFLYDTINTYGHYSTDPNFFLLTRATWNTLDVQIQNFQYLSHNNTLIPLGGLITYPNIPFIMNLVYFIMVMFLIVKLYKETQSKKKQS